MAKKTTKNYFSILLACHIMTIDCGSCEFSFSANEGDQRRTSKLCHQNVKEKSADCFHRQLETVPNDLMEDIHFLNLSNNHIRSVPMTTFLKYTFLTNLDLSHNDITVIEKSAFHPLNHLRALNLSHNPSLQLDTGEIFKGLNNLQSLSVSHCLLTKLPVNVLERLPELHEADFSHNNLTTINVTACGGKALQRLNLAANHIEELTQESCLLSCGCQILHLDFNPIKNVEPDAIGHLPVHKLSLSGFKLDQNSWNRLFKGISKSSIKNLKVTKSNLNTNLFNPWYENFLYSLDLSFNSWQALKFRTFENLTLLDELLLDNNNFVVIIPEYFAGTKSLRVLSLRNNHIRDIDTSHYSWNISIKALFLSGNDLTYIEPYIFYGLSHLEFLDLSDNMFLSDFEIDSSTGLEKLRSLDISNSFLGYLSLYTPVLNSCKISTHEYLGLKIPGDFFMHAKALEHVEIIAGLSHQTLVYAKELLFNGLTNLTFLYMRKNHFNKLPPKLFHGLYSLKILDLQENEMIFLDFDLFRDLKSLISLNLRLNSIIRLPLLINLHFLMHLDLDNNQLSYLDDNAFGNMSFLTRISLSNNMFVTFNKTTLQLPELCNITIDLSENPVACNCEFIWLAEWLRGFVRILNKEKMLCSTAPTSLKPLRGRNLLMLERGLFCGFNVSLCVKLILVTLATCNVAIIAYHFRWLLRYKCNMLKHLLFRYNRGFRDGRQHHNYDFDLNIMFTDGDEHWARDYLRPALEERLPHFERIAFGDDNLTLGIHYIDAVLLVVESSFKSIILLSRRAVKDTWFLMKIRVALDHVDDTQVDNVLLIFLENIPSGELPFILRLYLSERRSHIFWIEDERGQEYLWGEIVKHLERNRVIRDDA